MSAIALPPRRFAALVLVLATALLALAVASAPEAASAASAGTAKLKSNGNAIAPPDAPPRVRAVISAANEIEGKPYIWGGGHRSWKDSGYDCSGAVSYALHGGGLLDRPRVSGQLMRWGKRGKGRWITVYANQYHVYAVIAGLRWESAKPGSGPRWSREMRSSSGFVTRHRRNL